MASGSNAIGDRIRKRAKELGLTQKELAARAGLTTSNMNDIVKGRSDPGIGKLQAIADHLDVDLVWLVYGKTTEQRANEMRKKFDIREAQSSQNRRRTDGIPGFSNLIESLEKLSDESREFISDMADLWLKKEEKN
jgi:transcriptional regulator with XRE-family HTH domain